MATNRPAIRIEHTADRVVNQIQRNFEAPLRAALEPEFLWGADVWNLTFTGGQTRIIPHGLGRSPRGFVVIDAQGTPALLVRGPTNENTVALTSTNAGTYAVRFF